MVLPIDSDYLFGYELIAKISSIIPREEIIPERLYIEIPELTIASNPEHARCIFDRLHALGVNVICGDYRGRILEHLPSLDIDVLRLSNSLFSSDSRHRTILESHIAFCHSLKIRAMCLAVENLSQANLLTSLGCDYIAGNCFGGLFTEEKIVASMDPNTYAPKIPDMSHPDNSEKEFYSKE